MDESPKSAGRKDARKYAKQAQGFKDQLAALKASPTGKAVAAKASLPGLEAAHAAASQKLASAVAARDASLARTAALKAKLHAMQTGAKGGQFYTTSTGQKVYVK